MSRPALSHSNSPRFRPTRAKETAYTGGRPTCPRYLSAEARQCFRKLCKKLEQRRALTEGDGELLALYAVTWERWRKAMADVAVRGEVVISISHDKNDKEIEREKKNPWLVIAQESEKAMTGILDRLGMSPLNRERVKPLKKDEAKAPYPVGSVGAALIEFDRRKVDGERTGDEPVAGAVPGRYPNAD